MTALIFLLANTIERNSEYFDELENILILTDVGVSMVMKIVSEIKTEVIIRNITDPREINDIIVDKIDASGIMTFGISTFTGFIVLIN